MGVGAHSPGPLTTRGKLAYTGKFDWATNEYPLHRRQNTMTIDKSLKIRSGSLQNRNVLTRIERLEKLKESDRWQDGDSVFGLAKVRVEKLALKRKKKAKVEEDEALEGGDLDAAADAGDSDAAAADGGGDE